MFEPGFCITVSCLPWPLLLAPRAAVTAETGVSVAIGVGLNVS